MGVAFHSNFTVVGMYRRVVRTVGLYTYDPIHIRRRISLSSLEEGAINPFRTAVPFWGQIT